MRTIPTRSDAPESDRHLLYEGRTAAQLLAGDVPPESSGVFFREAEVLLCRAHLTPELLRPLGDEAGVVQWWFVDCDACRIDTAFGGAA